MSKSDRHIFPERSHGYDKEDVLSSPQHINALFVLLLQTITRSPVKLSSLSLSLSLSLSASTAGSQNACQSPEQANSLYLSLF